MTQLHFTLSQEEVLQVLAGNRDEAMRFLLERIVNEIMAAESEEQLKAAMHERTEDRTDYRNGTRDRDLTTRIGTLTLHVPRHRNEPFHTMIFENYKRSEASLIATMVQMVIAGVSTRKVSKVVETLCGASFSKSTVSELCKKLDADIDSFRNLRLDGIDAPFVMIDATYFKARENHKIVSKAFMVALAIKADGHKEVIAFDTYDTEDNYSWRNFLEDLKNRGLATPEVFISDSHKAIRKAIADIYPEAAWQRCQVHFVRNILDNVPSKYQEGLKIELREMFTAETLDEARKRKDEIVKDYEDVAEKAMQVLNSGFEDSMTIMCLPNHMRKVLRTTNIIERLNREFKRRSDVIQVFPNEESILRLMGAIALEYSDMASNSQRVYAEQNLASVRSDAHQYFIRVARKQLLMLEAA